MAPVSRVSGPVFAEPVVEDAAANGGMTIVGIVDIVGVRVLVVDMFLVKVTVVGLLGAAASPSGRAAVTTGAAIAGVDDPFVMSTVFASANCFLVAPSASFAGTNLLPRSARNASRLMPSGFESESLSRSPRDAKRSITAANPEDSLSPIHCKIASMAAERHSPCDFCSMVCACIFVP